MSLEEHCKFHLKPALMSCYVPSPELLCVYVCVCCPKSSVSVMFCNKSCDFLPDRIRENFVNNRERDMTPDGPLNPQLRRSIA